MKKNLLYPGLPNYQGPTKGFFTCLHHSNKIIEWSDDVMERVDYIVGNKASNEVDVRLQHIVLLDPNAFPYDDIDNAYIQKNIRELTRFLYKNVPDCKWDGVELRFPKEIVGDGDGYGDGYGNGYGDGTGYGNGTGNGDGYGDGNGDGYGDGNGNGDGYGNGYGYGNGNGDGNGNGYGDG